MKNTTTRAILILFLALMGSHLQAQDYFIEATFPTIGGDRFSVCGGERTITIKLTNTSGGTLSNNNISFVLPQGFDYTGGSLTGTGVSEVDISTPSFSFGSIAQGNFIEFSIDVEVLCEGIVNATGSANTTFDMDLTYNGGNGSLNYTSAAFEVVKPTLSIAKIDGTASINPPPVNAGKYNSETICVTVVNGGNGGLSTFEYWLLDHPHLRLDSLTIAGYGSIPISRVSGDTTFFQINSGMIANAIPYTGPGAEANNLDKLQFNESIDICENWYVENCSLTSPDLHRGIQYRCQSADACESSRNLQGVRFGFVRPEMVIGFIQDFGKNSPTCRGDTLLEHGFYITNTGGEAMTDLMFSIVTNWDNNGRGGTLLDTASIQFSTSSRNGPYFKLPIDFVREYPYPNSTCLDELTNIAPITRASYDTDERVFLMPGDTLFVRYGYKVGCNCGDINRNERTRIEYDYRRAIFGYRNETTRADNWTSVVYSDGCRQFTYDRDYLRTYFLHYYYYTRGIGAEGTSYDGDIETLTFQGQRNLSTNAYRKDSNAGTATNNSRHNINFDCEDCYQEYKYIFPKGVRWVGTDGDLATTDWVFEDDNGDTWSPSVVKYTQTTNQDTLIIRLKGKLPSGFWQSANSKFNLKYQIDCAEAGCGFFSGVPIKEEIGFNLSGDLCGGCIESPDITDRIETVPITFECPCNPCNQGMIVKEVKPERRTFGQGDNNNNTIAEAGETLDTTLLVLNRIIPGDTVRVTFRGEVKTSATFPDWEYAYANIRVPSDITDFLPLGATIKIWDVSTGTTYSCDVLQQFLDGQTIVTNISPENLKTLGCAGIPNNWGYESGDSMTVEVLYMPRTNIGGNIVPKIYGVDFYVSDQPYGGTKYQCNPVDFVMQHIGYAFDHNSYWSRYSMSGCSNGYSDFNHRARLGVSWNNRTSTDYFPYEVRAPFQPQKYTIIKKNDLEYTGRVRLIHYPLIVSHPNQRHDVYIDATDPYLTTLGDTLIIDYKGWYDANNNDKVSLDQGFYTRVFAEVKANCGTNASFTYDKFFDHRVEMKTDIRVHGQPVEKYERDDITDVRYTGGANLTIQVVPNTRVAIQEETCYNLDIVNAGNGVADNVFLSFKSLSGGIIIKGLYEVNNNNRTLVTPTALGLYQIGTVNNGNNSARTFEICLQTNNCSKDSMLISTGWDCKGYPATVDESTCNISEKIFIEPVISELGMVISSPTSATTSDLCDEVEYEIDISSADLGYLFDINLWLSLPPQMKYIAGSMELKYPLSSNYTTISDPINSIGNVYTINISEEDNTLRDDGLVGTLDVGNNIARVKFKVKTECNYTSGSLPKFLSFAYDACGRFVNYRVSPAPRHYINGISQSFASNIFMQDVALNACNEDQSTIDISMDLASASQPIGAGDSVRLILPEGVRYVANSYNPVNNAVNTTPSIEIENGSQVVYIDLEDGLGSGSTIQFTIDIEAYDVAQECREYDITVQAFNSQPAICGGIGNCNVRVISSESTRSVTIEKPAYQIEWNSAIVTPINASSHTLDYSVDLTNLTGIAVDASTGVTVEIYEDTDGDGRYSVGDILVGNKTHNIAITALQTVTLTGKITAPADKTCDLLAVIRPETTCTCSEDESFLLDAELNNTFDRMVATCSQNSITVGPASMTGYAYEWLGVDGSDVTALGSVATTPVQFNFENTTGNEIIWKYLLRVEKGNNCYSYDTLEVTIHPEVENQVTTGTCAGFPMPLNAPSGTTGIWIPTTNLVNPNDPNTEMTSISSTTTYTWNYTDDKGCSAEYKQTLALSGCSASTMIGNYVWRDDNRNGIQDGGEPPLSGVPVYLYDADDPTSALSSTITDVNGYYQFKPIPSGNYRVGFGNPYNYDVTTKNEGNDNEVDSDIDPSTLQTDALLIGNGDSVATVDAGFMPMQLIGNKVWSDANGNGIQEGGEVGIEGVTVSLYKVGGILQESITTNASGLFEFRVEPGDYYIVFDASTNISGINYVGVPQNAGSDTNIDSDADINNGQTGNFTLVAGADRLDIDAGFRGVEDCSNGVDDDGDGDTDCADSECQPIITAVNSQAPTCIGNGQNGKITITATGSGILSYSILNSPVWQSSNLFTNLRSGQYTVRVKNDAGCIATHSSMILFDVGNCPEICSDGIDNDGDGLVDCDDPDCDQIKGENQIQNGGN
ncbi:MAG: SdrD B-like domain-containing protein [Saprospiraceae bacterium]